MKTLKCKFCSYSTSYFGSPDQAFKFLRAHISEHHPSVSEEMERYYKESEEKIKDMERRKWD